MPAAQASVRPLMSAPRTMSALWRRRPVVVVRTSRPAAAAPWSCRWASVDAKTAPSPASHESSTDRGSGGGGGVGTSGHGGSSRGGVTPATSVTSITPSDASSTGITGTGTDTGGSSTGDSSTGGRSRSRSRIRWERFKRKELQRQQKQERKWKIARKEVRKATTFRMGNKRVYMPKYTITFLRTPTLSAEFAKFQVPLTFTKFDLRDYLYNLYGVAVLQVRSQVRSTPLQHRPLGHQVYRPASKKYMTVRLQQPFVWPAVPTGEKAESGWHQSLFLGREREWSRQAVAAENRARGVVPLLADAVWDLPEDELERKRLAFVKAGGKRSRRAKAELRDREKREQRDGVPSYLEVPDQRKALAKKAQDLREGRVKWEQGLELDPKWGGRGKGRPAAVNDRRGAVEGRPGEGAKRGSIGGEGAEPGGEKGEEGGWLRKTFGAWTRRAA